MAQRKPMLIWQKPALALVQKALAAIKKIDEPQNESTATKPTGWAVSASISTIHAVLRDSRGKVRSACSGRPVLATARAMASACAAGRAGASPHRPPRQWQRCAPASLMRVAIQPRRCSKLWPLCWSCPHKKARRTQRETQWYQAVSVRLTKAERGRVMAGFQSGRAWAKGNKGGGFCLTKWVTKWVSLGGNRSSYSYARGCSAERLAQNPHGCLMGQLRRC